MSTNPKPKPAPLQPVTKETLQGKMGGLTTLKKHGPAHYQRIGRRGGMTTAARHGRAHYSKISKLNARSVGLPVPENERQALARATGGAVDPRRLPAVTDRVAGARLPGGKGPVLR